MTARNLTLATAALLLVAAGTTANPHYGEEVPPYPDLIGTEAPESSGPAIPFAYGTDAFTAHSIPSVAFQHYGTSLGHINWSGGHIGPQNTDTYRFFTAPIQLPSGARIIGVTPYTFDNSATGYVRVYLFSQNCPGNTSCTSTTHFEYQTSTAGTPGYAGGYQALATPITWHNYFVNTQFMYARVYFSEGTSDLRVGPLVIWYKRQVSPAPASASFGDVPTGHWAFQHVQALVASGVTAGCGGGNFCPDTAVTRAQMAVFLAKALGLHWEF